MLHPTIAPYGAFACADGKVLLLFFQTCVNGTHYATPSANPAREGFASNDERVANRTKVDAFVGKHLGRNGREESIAFGRLSEIENLAHHPQNRFIKVTTPHGALEMLAPGTVVRGAEKASFGPVPERDANGAAIRTEFTEAARGVGAHVASHTDEEETS